MAVPQQQGLVRFVGNTEIEAMEKDRQDAEAAQNTETMHGLVGYLRKCWQESRRAKEPIERELLESLRQVSGEYEPSKLNEIREQGGSELYMELSAVKVRAAKSWLKDIITSDKPWTLDPTKIAEMPPRVEEEMLNYLEQQAMAGMIPLNGISMEQKIQDLYDRVMKALQEQAKEAAGRMEDKIEDQLQQGGFRKAMDQFIDDVCTYKNGFIRGPVIRKRKSMKWERTENGFQPNMSEELRYEEERVSPFDIYPSADSKGINDGYLIERYPMIRAQLHTLIGVEGFDEGAIRGVLDEYGRGGLREWLYNDHERASLENRPYEWFSGTDKIEALLFWIPIQGTMLLSWGMDPALIPDPLEEYEVNAWLVDRWVIGLTMNDDPLGRRPYSTASYEDVPGSFWGRCPAELMRDIQNMCNAIARAIVNNLAIGSGPMAEVHTDRLAPGEDVTNMHPWKIFQTTSDQMGSGRAAVNFFQPDVMVDKLLKVYDYFSKLADDYTGIPSYAYGSMNVGGAGKTASGLSMLFNASSKGIKQVVGNIDIGVIEPIVERQYYWNMLLDPDPSIKGDVKVKARGAVALIMKEQLQMRRNEFLQTTNNPADLAIMGAEGRSELLREAIKTLDLDPDKIIPEEIERSMGMPGDGQADPGAPLNPDGSPAGGQQSNQFSQ